MAAKAIWSGIRTAQTACSSTRKERFLSSASLRLFLAFVAGQGFVVSPERQWCHDLDALSRWLEHPTAEGVDCSEFLSAWNLFGDVSASIGGDFDADRDRTLAIYDKLFWGCNLPSMTPPGKRYDPVWPPGELRVMADVLQDGLRLFRSRIRVMP